MRIEPYDIPPILKLLAVFNLLTGYSKRGACALKCLKTISNYLVLYYALAKPV